MIIGIGSTFNIEDPGFTRPLRGSLLKSRFHREKRKIPVPTPWRAMKRLRPRKLFKAVGTGFKRGVYAGDIGVVNALRGRRPFTSRGRQGTA
jgi:hypothetical protein